MPPASSLPIPDHDRDWLQALLASPLDAVIGADLDGRIILWNGAAEHIYGFPAKEALGQPLQMILPPEHRDEASRLLKTVRLAEPVPAYTTAHLRKNGMRVELQVAVSPLRDRDGNLWGAALMAREITVFRSQVRETAQAGERRLRYHLENSPLAVVEWNPQGEVLRWTGAAERLFGWRADEVLGRRWADLPLVCAGDWPAVEANVARLASGAEIRTMMTNRNRHRGGSTLVCEWYNSVLRDQAGRVVSILSLALDVTERHRVEEALRQDIAERKITEQALRESEERFRESEERFRAVLDNSLDCVYRFNLQNQRYDYVSPASESVLGYTAEEFMALSAEAALGGIHPDDLPAVRDALAALERGGRVEVEYRFRGMRGAYRWVSNHISLAWDKAGRPLYRYGNVRDITHRKQAEHAMVESEQRLKEAQQIVHLGHWSLELHDLADVNRNPLRWSDEVFRIFGYAPQQVAVTNELFFQHVHPEDRDKIQQAVAASLAQGIPYDIEHRILRADGAERIVHELSQLDYDSNGRPVRLVGTVLDVTERKRLEEALREAAAVAEGRARELAETDRRKDEYLAMLAHELRNPLAPIRNAAHLLRQAGVADPFLKRQRDVIDRQVTHMARLLDDLLDVSRITRGLVTLHKQALQVTRILVQALETTQPLLAGRRHTLNYQPPAPNLVVSGDPDRLAQVVGNLLTNAAKFTPEGGEIRLEARLEGNDAVIRVTDNGVGIEPGMLPRVFDLFAQSGRSLDRSQGGLGIGLTIVNDLVRMHGGSVEARSEGVNRGSEFVVRIPAMPASDWPEGAAVAGKDAGRFARPRRILVVEDIRDTADSLAEVLNIWGHEVRVAYDGEQALEVMPVFKPDTVLLDIGLPKIDGYEVARRIRKGFGQSVRIIAMTGYGQPQARQQAQEAGIGEYLVKPLDLDKLQRVVTQP